MTSRRAQRRAAVGRGREESHADQLAVVVCWCAAEADLPDARKATHDGLIKMLGDRRRGGVTWRWWSGDTAREMLDELTIGSTQEASDYYRRLRAMLREHGGIIVAASAPGAL